MTAKRKASTKTDIDAQIAKIEAKIDKLSASLESKPTPKPAETTQEVPKPEVTIQTTPAEQSIPSTEKSKKQQLEEYENDYLQRLEQERIEQANAQQEMLEAEAKDKSQSNRGSLPKGFKQTEPEVPKTRGTLPKGF